MIRKSFILIILLSTFSFQPSASPAESMSSNELIENAKALDGKTVVYKGELVTAVLRRGAHSWINMNDGNNAIGVWCASAALKDVKFMGDYKNRGDILEVEGRFNRACQVHKGELDIHAYSLKILKQGHQFKERLNTRKLALSTVLFFITILVVVLFKKRI